MITEEQYNEAKRIIKKYESEQLDLLRVMRYSRNFSAINTFESGCL